MIFSFISCGKDGRFIANSQQEVIYKVEPAAEEKYEYEFFLQDCSTGIQRFDSFIDACNGLTDEQRNKSCAREERRDLFINSECPGSF